MAEGLERLLLGMYCDRTGTYLLDCMHEGSVEKFDRLLETRDEDTLDTLLEDEVFQTFRKDNTNFRCGVSIGDLGKTAQFWFSYTDHVWLVLSLLQAVKKNDYYLYGACLSEVADLFFSFNGSSYARYTTFFSLFLTNIEETHSGASKLLKFGAIRVDRSFVSGKLCAVNKTIEETFMRHAKSHAGSGSRDAGASGILTNYAAYRRWARTTHERSRYVDVML